MTGISTRSGQTGRPADRRVTATAVLAAASLLASLGLSSCGSDPSRASTVLRSARAVTLELATGGAQAAVVGMTVPRGATVRTGPGGSATLVAAGRTVLLGGSSAVTVLDGRHEQLRQGLVLVDARRAAGLTLDAGPATVQTPDGGVSRVERGALLRAAAYRKELRVRATGRRSTTDVPALRQVQVPDGGLPGRVTPLVLTPHDAWERAVALDLVTADAELVALADGLDRNPASGSAVVRAIPATYAAAAPPVSGEPRSETALAYVLARATHRPAPAGFSQVRELRQDGGSWGVVAAIVGADVAAVSSALDAVLNPTEGPAVLAGGGGAVGPIGPLLGAVGTTPGFPADRPPGSQGGQGGRPGSTARPRPSPSPSSSSDPVNDVVTTVTGLVPTPTPTPTTGVSQPVAPSPSPTPLISVRLPGVTATVG